MNSTKDIYKIFDSYKYIKLARSVKIAIKHSIYWVLYKLHLFDAALAMITRLRRDHPCIILLYHRIVDDQTVFLNKGPVVHHHIRDFEKEIAWLKNRFEVLSMDEVIDKIERKKRFSRPSVAITFDDGYLDNFTLAYPVLKANGIPAIIYLATGLISSTARTWPDQIEAALILSSKKIISLPEILPESSIPIETMDQKRHCCVRLSHALKEVSNDERERQLAGILRTLEVSLESLEDSNSRIMLSWEEIKEMASNNISFGSHSHTHPILSRVPLDEAKDDINRSKVVIEEHLGQKVRHFAYPNGRREDFTEDLRTYCKEIGFDTVATVVYGTVDVVAEPLALKRIGVVSPLWHMAGELTRLILFR